MTPTPPPPGAVIGTTGRHERGAIAALRARWNTIPLGHLDGEDPTAISRGPAGASAHRADLARSGARVGGAGPLRSWLSTHRERAAQGVQQ